MVGTVQVPGVDARVRGRLHIASLQSAIFEHPLTVGPEIDHKVMLSIVYSTSSFTLKPLSLNLP